MEISLRDKRLSTELMVELNAQHVFAKGFTLKLQRCHFIYTTFRIVRAFLIEEQKIVKRVLKVILHVMYTNNIMYLQEQLKKKTSA
jgi:hypothetical protein